MGTSVALIIFNRPDMTERVLTEIAKARPEKLFVIADGPRPDRPADAAKCAAARAVIDRVDWDCEVFKNYSEINLGCGRRPATGISWVFEHVEEAIILEDDCVPHPTFFRFCEELLEKYRDDERVMHIAGHNFQFGRTSTPDSYFFSRFNIAWGWATWRRAWKYHDLEVRLWPALRETTWLTDIIGDSTAVQYWQNIFADAYAGKGAVDYWDHQWTFACWSQNGLSVLPSVNLASNIGCGKDGTHTLSAADRRANLPTAEMRFPLRHPRYVIRDREADQTILEKVVLPDLPRKLSVYRKLRQKCVGVVPPRWRKFLKAQVGF